MMPSFFERLDNTLTVRELQRACEDQEYHDYSFPTIYCYKDYPKLSKKNAFSVEKEGIAIEPSPIKKEFYFFKTPTIDALQEKLNKGYRCTSPEKVIGMPGSAKRAEALYTFSEVFNPESYPNAKKRYQRITYPSTFLQRENITIRELSSEQDTAEAVQLHEMWIKDKMNNPNVFHLSLNTARYRRCTTYSVDFPESFRRFGVWDSQGKLVAVRIIGVQKKRAFDLAFYSDYKNMKSQMTEYINVVIMKMLYDQGFETLNSGLATDKGLKQFKEHYPHKMLLSYQYKGVSL